ncbi:MAG: glycogen/starch/alpha-glucan family phosphorylase, partial [Deltaproteobacteria bacterium]
KFGGHTESYVDIDGITRKRWMPAQMVKGIPYDTPEMGYKVASCNFLRMWKSEASDSFDFSSFNHGDYFRAVMQKMESENISKVLYPNDEIYEGRELRLKQQYFFVSCSIQDIIRRYFAEHDTFDAFSSKVAIQMNDTHPSLAVAELMRLLLDVYNLNWDTAWEITTKSCAYTNHTLLSEALEKWPISLFGKLLPRHLQIIFEINRRFLRDVATIYIGDKERIRRMSIIEEEGEKKIRMAHLAIVGSHAVNGVAALHTRLLKEKELRDFDQMYPGKITNKTNGVTPRRWLLSINPGLSELISKHIGQDWVKDLDLLRQLEPLATDASFQKVFQGVKRNNKVKLAELTLDLTGIRVDPLSIFDFQVKRIHEYKRQLLNILHVIYCWLKLKTVPDFNPAPRTFFFGGKAAPGYITAKRIIKLICHVAEMVNRDPFTSQKLKVVFLPNYRVSLAEKIFPAADVSEQISTAGFEASGTSNMKFALNGALTVGTLDGANIEIMEEVGPENIFIFGLNTEEVNAVRSEYDPYSYYQRDPVLKETVDLIQSGFFNPEERELFHPLVEQLIHQDHYLILAD